MTIECLKSLQFVSDDRDFCETNGSAALNFYLTNDASVALPTVTNSVSLFSNTRRKKFDKMSENLDVDSTDFVENENLSKASITNFTSIDVTTHTSSSAILQWSYERPPTIESSRQVVFKLLLLESRDEWKSLAWTRKTTCKIENLEQNVCYSLQLLVLVETKDDFKVVDKSEVFKVKH